MSKPSPDPRQEELAFMAVRAHVLWEGRINLRVGEVAKALRCVEQHVLNLIECGRLGAIDISSGRPFQPGRDKLHRQAIRIPVSAWDEFIKSSQTL